MGWLVREQNSSLLLKLWQWGREKERSRRLEWVQGERLCCGLFYLRIQEIWVLCAPDVKPVERRKRLKMLSRRWTERSCGWRSQPGKRGRLLLPPRGEDEWKRKRWKDRAVLTGWRRTLRKLSLVTTALWGWQPGHELGTLAAGSCGGPGETWERLESSEEASARSAGEEWSCWATGKISNSSSSFPGHDKRSVGRAWGGLAWSWTRPVSVSVSVSVSAQHGRVTSYDVGVSMWTWWMKSAVLSMRYKELPKTLQII